MTTKPQLENPIEWSLEADPRTRRIQVETPPEGVHFDRAASLAAQLLYESGHTLREFERLFYAVRQSRARAGQTHVALVPPLACVFRWPNGREGVAFVDGQYSVDTREEIATEDLPAGIASQLEEWRETLDRDQRTASLTLRVDFLQRVP